MASMDHRMILGVQQPDFVNTLARSTAAAGMANQNRRQNALDQVYQQYGQDIAQGGQRGLNALAAVDPMASLNIQNTLADNKRADATLEMQRERLGMAKQEAARLAARQAFEMDQAQLEAAEERMRGLLTAGNMFYQNNDRAGYEAFAAENDIDIPYDQLEISLAKLEGSLEGVMKAKEYAQGPKPADEYGRYVAEERAAGREPLSRIEYAQAKKGKGFSVTTKDGTTVTYGGPVDSTSNSAANPSSAMSMINTIDGILNDPALEYSTGILSPLQKVPGTPMKRFEGRANQLGGQAFLQAFESLKGGGQITEIEGAKATQAMGRLDTAQSPEDYRDALTELRSILAVAAERPQGWVDTQRKINDAQELIPADDIKAMTPDQILQLGPDAITRIPASELKGLSAEQWDALEALAGQ